MIQDVEEEEEADEHPVRQNIRETLEVGVRRMNLNAAAAAVKETGGGGAGSSSGSGSRRELENRIKKVDRLQSQIEQSFRTVKKEFLKGTSQGKKKNRHSYWHCCGSGSRCFWPSWIRIRRSEVRIRILLSSSKNSKKNLDSFCFCVTSI
jgi:hypothetical protein